MSHLVLLLLEGPVFKKASQNSVFLFIAFAKCKQKQKQALGAVRFYRSLFENFGISCPFCLIFYVDATSVEMNPVQWACRPQNSFATTPVIMHSQVSGKTHHVPLYTPLLGTDRF